MAGEATEHASVISILSALLASKNWGKSSVQKSVSVTEKY